MGRRLLRALLVVGVLACAAPAVAAPPSVQAKAYILVNPATGEVLAAKNPDRELPMASTTKLMTAIVALQRSTMTTTVTVPSGLPGGSTADLVPGERISMKMALTGLMVSSGNDAAVSIATTVGKGSVARFVSYMNAEAAEMGLTHTHFVNPHGLDAAGHHSSVRDLVSMGERAMESPFIRTTVSHQVSTIPGPNGVGTRRLQSENDLLGIDPEADGVKTGHTSGAGYSIVAHSTRASTKTGLYLAMIGSPSRAQRAQDARRLLRWGQSQYVRVNPLRGDQIITRVPVRDRPGTRVALVTDTPFATTVRLGTRLTRTVVMPVELQGPIAKGTAVGEVRILVKNRVVGKRKLVVDQDVDGPSLMERVRSGVGRIL